MASSSTNRGTTWSAPDAAAASIGLSWTRRSRVNRARATVTPLFCPRRRVGCGSGSGERAALHPGRPRDVPVGPPVAVLERPWGVDDLHDVADVGLVEQPDGV